MATNLSTDAPAATDAPAGPVIPKDALGFGDLKRGLFIERFRVDDDGSVSREDGFCWFVASDVYLCGDDLCVELVAVDIANLYVEHEPDAVINGIARVVPVSDLGLIAAEGDHSGQSDRPVRWTTSRQPTTYDRATLEYVFALVKDFGKN